MSDYWLEDTEGDGFYTLHEAEYVKPKTPYKYMQEVYVTSDLFTGRGYFLKHYDIGHLRRHYVMDIECIYEQDNGAGEKEFICREVHTFEPLCVKSVVDHASE